MKSLVAKTWSKIDEVSAAKALTTNKNTPEYRRLASISNNLNRKRRGIYERVLAHEDGRKASRAIASEGVAGGQFDVNSGKHMREVSRPIFPKTAGIPKGLVNAAESYWKKLNSNFNTLSDWDGIRNSGVYKKFRTQEKALTRSGEGAAAARHAAHLDGRSIAREIASDPSYDPAGAISIAQRKRNRSRAFFPKEAISKAWEHESKPGRSTITKQLSMIDGHRKQISESEGGMAGAVLDRHKKVKQSIGDSMKLAGIKDFVRGVGKAAIRPVDDALWAVENHLAHFDNIKTNPGGPSAWKNSRDRDLGMFVGGLGTLGGAYALGKHRGRKEKSANGDMLQYFIDNPDKLKEKQERDRKKKEKVAVTLGELLLGTGLAGAGIGAATAPKGKRLRRAAIGAVAAPVGLAGGAMLAHEGGVLAQRLMNKTAMLPNQPPAEPKVQQDWRGRPPKMKNTQTVSGTVNETASMLSPASTTAGPTQ